MQNYRLNSRSFASTCCGNTCWEERDNTQDESVQADWMAAKYHLETERRRYFEPTDLQSVVSAVSVVCDNSDAGIGHARLCA